MHSIDPLLRPRPDRPAESDNPETQDHEAPPDELGPLLTDTRPSERVNGDPDENAGDAPDEVPTIETPDTPRRRKRVSKWDRPRPPMDWRWWISHVGRVLIAIGLLMFGFLAYQLWGTAIETARAQNALENEFEGQLAEVDPIRPLVTTPAAESTTPSARSDSDADIEVDADGGAVIDIPVADPAPAAEEPPVSEPIAVPLADQNIPIVENGDAIARMEIPRIGLNDIVVAGVGTSDLKKGPGHYPDTPLPGQLGNAAIAGHRTTYGAPFFDVDKLEPGDEIIVTTLSGRFVYRVTGQQIVDPSDYQVVSTVDPTVATLTLTSCDPKYTAQRRIVISAVLVEEESAPVGEAILNYGRDLPAEVAAESDGLLTIDEPTLEAPEVAAESVDTPDEPATADEPATTDAGAVASDETPAPDDVESDATAASADADGGATIAASAATTAGIADAFADGWFSDPGAPLHVALWGLLLAAIGLLAYLISRRLRRDWAGALIGIVPFVITLYFFFQNVNRLLPPNL